MADGITVGDRVQVLLNTRVWGIEGWFEGTVVRIDSYTQHRSFYWVELSEAAAALPGKGSKLISVLNPKNIRKV